MNSQHAVIFDFFGVISSEVAPFWLERYFEHETAVRIKADIVAKGDAGLLSAQEMFGQLSELTNVSPDQILADWLELSVIDHSVVQLIREWKDRVPVALLSNASAPFLRRVLETEDLYGLFTEVLISSDIGITKPDPSIYKQMLLKLGLKPDGCIMIDDNSINLEGAAAAGIPGILFTGSDPLRSALTAWAENNQIE